jgi:hypothetical protein
LYRESETASPIGSSILLEIIHTGIAESKDHEYGFLKRIIAELPTAVSTPAEYLYLANVFVAVKEKLYFKLKQIESGDYGWITEEVMAHLIHVILATTVLYLQVVQVE